MAFIVVVKAGGAGFNLEMVEQLGRVAGIFGGDQIHFLEDADCPRAEVLEVANWGGDQVEGAHACS